MVCKISIHTFVSVFTLMSSKDVLVLNLVLVSNAMRMSGKSIRRTAMQKFP